MKIFPKRIRFDQRLFIYFFAIFLFFSSVVTLFQYQREKQFCVDKLESSLSDYNKIVVRYLYHKDYDFDSLDSLVKLFPDTTLRVTVMTSNGDVLFDSFVGHRKKLENHFYRPEIQQALKTGSGSAIRHSASTDKEYYYVANKFDHYFVRSALPYNVDVMDMLNANPLFLYFMILMFILTVVVLVYISSRIGKSISQLRDFAFNAEKDTIAGKEHHFTNDELGEISSYIVDIYKRLRRTRDDLYTEREKLYKHLQISQEGLAIFSHQKKEILVNNHFLQYIDVISDRQLDKTDEVFELPEFAEINNFIDNVLSKDDINRIFREHLTLRKNGRVFIVKCIIFQDNSFEISINDITQQEQENQLKRQLTQNVSHELKTPVSSIQGYMETIINNPEMDPERLKFFIERCFVQATRLTQLLQDISLLNKIDEADSLFERELIHVNEVITDVLKDVSLQIEEKKVVVDRSTQTVMVIKGNRSLLYSIFRNLVDNSLAYAGTGFTLGIHCYREDENYFYFSCYDTGAGVSEEHLSRLFERFYRVDTGRSRKMGGTGLGLAIVKNAVLFHHGKITARNRAEGGLEFLFTLSKTS
ncbi:MAG: ATP-binding protein [Paludibacteraceae bacterium]|nr:ATP-binding protein [Paludibacteraceae bacterium]